MSSLSDKERDELLIRLDERMHATHEVVHELKTSMKSDDGFARCQVHKEKVATIEKSVKVAKRLTWAAVLALLGKLCWEALQHHFFNL